MAGFSPFPTLAGLFKQPEMGAPRPAAPQPGTAPDPWRWFMERNNNPAFAHLMPKTAPAATGTKAPGAPVAMPKPPMPGNATGLPRFGSGGTF
jgi:hypothetical protein